MMHSKRFLIVLLSAIVALCLIPQMAFAAAGSTSGSDPSASTANLRALDADTIAGTPAKKAKASLKVRGYSQGNGWKGWKKGGKTVGLEDARLQLLKINLTKSGVSGTVKYRAYTYNKGWQKWMNKNMIAGSKGNAIMGVQIKLTGDLANYYDVVYRVNHAERGWLPWAANGSTAGLVSKLLGINQIQVKLVKKGSAQKLADGAYAIGVPKNSWYVLGVPQDKMADNVQATKVQYLGTEQNERFYVRNEADGTISIQSASSGKFLCEAANGTVVQRADSEDASYRWTLTPWDGGYVVKNAASGNNLVFSGTKVKTGKIKSRWAFASVGLVADGNHMVVNNAEDNVLDLKDMSFNDNANIRVRDSGSSSEGAQAFAFTNKGADVYRIDNAATFKPIEVAGGSSNDGANVRQGTWKSSGAQKWAVALGRDGKLTFTNVASGKVLTAVSGGESGANVVSSADEGGAAQRWTLKRTSFKSSPGAARATQKASGMGSNTNYLILVDLTNHWLTIFKRNNGSWQAYKDWQISCGAPSTPTVVGHYTVGSRGYSFGHGYTCYYWTQFYGDYLFHSVKYYEGTFKIMDGRLGRSISQGCVRMNINNAKWINQNIPSGTHVYIYR